MELSYFGATAIRIKGKNAMIAIDPTGEMAKLETDITAYTHKNGHDNASPHAGIILDGPGEYEVKGIHVVGIAEKHAEGAGSPEGHKTAYVVTVDGVSCLHLGTFSQNRLDDDQLATFENVDILLVPIGGVDGSGLNAGAAGKMAAQLESTLIVPLFLGTDQEALRSQFLKDMGKEQIEPVKKLVMTADKLPEEPQVVILESA